MSEALFEIGADGVDVEALVERLRQRVEEKTARGVYADPRVARAERTNLANLRDDEHFLEFYLECLRDAVFVDISDFEIYERRARFSVLFVGLKRVLWKLLKFYTYRLWSQQNQVNGLLLSAIEGTEARYRDKIRELEARVQALETSSH